MRKKIILISYYDWYEKRLSKVEKVCRDLGYEVKCYTSNFDHITKKKREPMHNENVVLIDVPKYNRNISLRRLYSLWIFSRKIRKLLFKEEPEIVYCIVPPNSLVKNIILPEHSYKVIFDVMDLWPESMPIGYFEKTFIYKKWKELRDSYIHKADYIITECDLFKEKIEEYANSEKIVTIYLTREMSDFYPIQSLDQMTIRLCYIGSINNIIDIDQIGKIVREIMKYKMVVLHIIGEGENKGKLISTVKKAGAEVFDHGIVYNQDIKREIINYCHYGLNIYKKKTCIGVTMKSIDYFQFGLPIINSISADTKQFILRYKCGYNLENIDYEFISHYYDLEMRIKSRKVYEENFTKDILRIKYVE